MNVWNTLFPVKLFHKMISDDPEIKLLELADTLEISKEPVGYIIYEYTGMRNLCAKWMPQELKIDQK